MRFFLRETWAGRLGPTVRSPDLGRLTPDQLISFRAYYRAEVQAEETAEAITNGASSGKDVLIRFNSP